VSDEREDAEKDRESDGLATTGARAREKAPRSSPEEVEARISKIADVAVRGEWSKAMGRQLVQAWGISERTLSGYVTEAFRRIGMGEAATDLAERRANNLLKLDAVYELALASGDFKAAVASIKESNALAGLSKTKVELTGKDGAPLGLPADHPLLSLGRPPTVEELEAYAKGDNNLN